MKNCFIPTLLLLLGLSWVQSKKSVEQESGPEPSDYLWAQRAYPYGTVPSDAFYHALAQVRQKGQDRGNGAVWELAGPTNVSGRITDVAMHPTDSLTVYAAAASGGVWKSEDAGDHWFPITDDLPSLSIGDIAIDPQDKNTLYVGTGEPNGGGGSIAYDGRGVFKSMDGGVNWTPLGLEATGSIGRIEVDPLRPNRIFVAAMGHLFANNPERGIFRSEDGGSSWEKTLFVNDSTGGIDLAIHPVHPDTVFAVTWQRTRRPNKRMYGGPGCGIYRSVDGGDHWEKLANGLPASNLGRIGIAISPSEPSTLYAIYSDEIGFFKGVYKSTDNGDSWSELNGGNPGYPGFGWWFGQIRVHPHEANTIYTLGLDWLKSSDSGQFWEFASLPLHADYHAFYIHPLKPDFQVVGNDGGVYISTNGGVSWSHRPFPITQFYTSEIDFQNPNSIYGGAQDNGTWRTLTGALDDWQHIFGGDGFVTLVNPLDNSIFYGESQYGGFAGTNGATAPTSSRYNWNTPYIFDPNDPSVMYFGAEKLFKSTNGGLNWVAISGDLSNGPTGQNGVQYGTITTISASPINPDLIWVGTDDGNVWVTSNGGGAWTKVSDNLPKRWITKVLAHPYNPDIAFVCLSGYRHFDDMAHIYRSQDRGQSWQSVGGDLPDVPINDLILDEPDRVWYVATDAGVFVTASEGEFWYPFNDGLPTVPVTDLTYHPISRTLVAATFGRAMFKTEIPIYFGTNSPQTFGHVKVSPNPFVEHLQVSMEVFQGQKAQIDLYDLSGKKLKTVFEGTLPAGPRVLEIDGSSLPAGVYLLQLRGVRGSAVCQKIVKL